MCDFKTVISHRESFIRKMVSVTKIRYYGVEILVKFSHILLECRLLQIQHFISVMLSIILGTGEPKMQSRKQLDAYYALDNTRFKYLSQNKKTGDKIHANAKN